MLPNRRQFLKFSALFPAFFGKNPLFANENDPLSTEVGIGKPTIVSTWDFGKAANEAAWEIVKKGGRALDAVEAGVRVTEADPNINSVGYGGLPDRDGRVTLDACIMDETGRAGSVCCVENIMHPVSVARLVMEKTPHVMLVGEGAQAFALANGFEKQDLLTEKSKEDWQNWLKTAQYSPRVNSERHDTIGQIVFDQNRNLAGACTTSGMAYKMHGRVGDSPIIGAGLYVDNEVGAATGTGLGETVLRTCAAFLIVELMRQGKKPQQACEIAIKRIYAFNKNIQKDVFQVGMIAVSKNGSVGAFAIQKGFQYAFTRDGKTTVFDAPSLL